MVFACTNASVKMKTKTNVWSVLLFCYILAKKKMTFEKEHGLADEYYNYESDDVVFTHLVGLD